jgi:lysophospholipase L1-like esterase
VRRPVSVLLALWIAVAVLAAACAGHALPRQQAQTVAPSAPAAAETPPRARADALQAVVIGDEFAFGTISGGSASKNWTAILQRLAAQSGIDVYIRNFSHDGAGYTATVPGVPTFGEQVARGVNPDTNLVILAGGGNDINALPALHDDAVATLNRVKSVAPQAGMLVVGPSWWRPGPPDGAILFARNVIRGAADEAGVPFIDPIAEDWFGGRDGLMSPDHLHINAAGQHVIAEHLAEPVVAALRQQHPATVPSP